jgi:hypothetical protein
VLKILSGEIELGAERIDGAEGAEGVGGTAAYAAEHPRDRMYFNGGGQGFLTDTEQVR